MTWLARNADENLLFPPFRQRLMAGLQTAQAAGMAAHLFEGWRSAERQEALYNQGRSQPGQIITMAHAWGSWHQYGLAADIAFGGPGNWSWEGDWQRLGEIMQELGLEWFGAPGAKFKELPHFQMVMSLDMAQMSALAHAEGQLAVWSKAGALFAASSH